VSLTRSIGILVPLFLGAGPVPASTEAADPLAVAAPLVGRWEADADPKMPGVTGWTVFERAAQGHALVRKNHAAYPATKDHPASTHDDVLLLYSENGQLRAEYVDNEGHVIRYRVQAPGPSTLTFLSEAGGFIGVKARLRDGRQVYWPPSSVLAIEDAARPEG